MSHIRYHVSGQTLYIHIYIFVTYCLSYMIEGLLSTWPTLYFLFYIFINKFRDNLVELVSEGSFIRGAAVGQHLFLKTNIFLSAKGRVKKTIESMSMLIPGGVGSPQASAHTS